MKKTFLIFVSALVIVFSMVANQPNALAETTKSLAFGWGDIIGLLPTPSPSPAPAPTTNEDATSSCTFNGQGQETCKLENPIEATEVTDIIRIVITAALGLIGAFTLLMFVWGGTTWLLSAGNPEKVSAGTQTMVWAIIGVMVVLLSYVWLSAFLRYLTS